MVTLARQLTRTMESPIWPAVRRPAPWQTAPETAHG
jgi:nitrogenase molybdenum-cofactor synthesis protein NifE